MPFWSMFPGNPPAAQRPVDCASGFPMEIHWLGLPLRGKRPSPKPITVHYRKTHLRISDPKCFFFVFVFFLCCSARSKHTFWGLPEASWKFSSNSLSGSLAASKSRPTLSGGRHNAERPCEATFVHDVVLHLCIYTSI